MLIDSGSDWNVLSETDWGKLKNDEAAVLFDMKENPGESAWAYGATAQLKTLRSFHAWVEAQDTAKSRILAKFRVVKNEGKSILGHQTGTRMKLLQVGMEVNSVEEVRAPQEFPSIPNLCLEFDIDNSVTPTKNAYVNNPAAFKNRAIERLEKMEAEGIIEKVTRAPRWISGMSAVPKGKDDFRLVINMIGPNRAICRRFYKMPTMEEIKVKLNGAKYFTKLDLTNAFHHVMLG